LEAALQRHRTGRSWIEQHFRRARSPERAKGISAISEFENHSWTWQAEALSSKITDNEDPNDWKRFLADPEKQWKRGYSAMAAALSWEAANGVPPEISKILGGSVELLLAIPEHKVALPGGRRESQCDVFALIRVGNETMAIAVEAKVNEPFGPTVSEWMVNARKGRLNAWVSSVTCWG
jgi:hypothetical protein